MIEQITFSRQELYSLVWEHPLSYFTNRYMVSYPSFKNICKENDIPLPPGGYWSKKKFGKEGLQPEYSKLKNEKEIVLYVIPEGDNRDFGYLTKMDKKILEIEADPKVNLTIPEKLPPKMDPIIKATKKWFKNEIKIPENLDYYDRYSPGPIRCWVSEKHLKRSLIILSVLVKNIKARGHDFTFGRYHSFVKLYGIETQISISEKNKRVKIQGKYGSDYKSEPTGMLSILAGENFYSKTWNDAKTVKLDSKLSTIIAWLEIEAEDERQREIKRKIREEERKEQERMKKEKQELIQQEMNTFKYLHKKSQLWHEAQKLRKYLRKFEEQLEEDDQLTKENIEMLHFGFQKADWLDPFTTSEDDLFSDLDPYNLLKKLV